MTYATISRHSFAATGTTSLNGRIKDFSILKGLKANSYMLNSD